MSDEKSEEKVLDVPKLVQLPEKPSEFAIAAEKLKRELNMMIEASSNIARIKKAQYDAFLDAGFTPQQAMELIK